MLSIVFVNFSSKPIGLLTSMTLLLAISGSGCSVWTKHTDPVSSHVEKNPKIYLTNPEESKIYQEECAACHIGYVPGFLPERSWKKMMSDLENHFGQNAALDEPAKGEILAYLTKNSADGLSASARSNRIARMIPKEEVPIRITESPFWKRKHGSIKAFVWGRASVKSRAKCDSCHADASKGIFNEHTAKIPK